MQILQPTTDLLNEDLWGGGAAICVLQALQVIVMKLNFEKYELKGRV